MSRKLLLGILGALGLMLAVGCILQYRKGRQTQFCTRQIFAMDTVMELTAYGEGCEEAVEAAVEEIERLDALLSTGDTGSEISRLNQTGNALVSEDTKILLQRALEVSEDTDGLFDPTIYPLMNLWGFPTGEYHVPDSEELAEVLPLVDASKVRLEETSPGEVSLGEGQQIDLGGIGKGYTSGRVMEIYREHGITSGIVSLGGNVQTLGVRPDGKKWRVGIQDPDSSQGEILAVLETEDRAVITSGGYERYFEENGKTYIHILDPRTGYPAEGDLESVTVVSLDGALADALSTSLYLMGLEGACSYWREHSEAFDMILITQDNEIYATEKIRENLDAKRAIITVNE